MRTCLLTAAAIGALALGAAGALVPRVVEAQFQSRVELVTLGVTVTDRRGTFITDLTRDDFEIREDGRMQSITSFARGDGATDDLPLHLGLLFDTSGSMGEDIKLARSAA